MDIRVPTYQLELSEAELWNLTFSLKHDLEDREKLEHSKQHRGIITYNENYKETIALYDSFTRALRRPDMYADTMRLINNFFKD